MNCIRDANSHIFLSLSSRDISLGGSDVCISSWLRFRPGMVEGVPRGRQLPKVAGYQKYTSREQRHYDGQCDETDLVPTVVLSCADKGVDDDGKCGGVCATKFVYAGEVNEFPR